MTPMLEHLIDRITRDGPLTIARFMKDSLTHPDHGYYMTRDPLGERGDFVTAPEISQVFGELIGLWCARVWQSMGSPDRFRWVEMGPGRGTMMTDAIRATRPVEGFHKAARIHFIETSPVLMDKQKAALSGAGIGRARWHDDISQVPDGPAIVLANEFFDALPVRHFQKVVGGWRERLVGLTDTGDGLRFTLSSDEPKPDSIPAFAQTARDGDIVETSPTGRLVIRTVAKRIKTGGGAALVIDYGHSVSATGETLQAVHGHARADVLANPGEQDLTAHVDFQALRTAALSAGVAVCGPMGQGAFLQALGLSVRARQLAGAARSAEQRRDVAAGADRLVNPAHMGRLFKVMGLMSGNITALPGFE